MGFQTCKHGIADMCKHGIADICKHTQLFTWVWGSKLRSWCFCGRHLTNQTVSPAARPFLIWDDGSTYWWHLLIEEYACQEGHCNLNLLNRMEFRHVEMSNIICPITTFLGNTSVPNTQKWVVLLEAVAGVQVFCSTLDTEVALKPLLIPLLQSEGRLSGSFWAAAFQWPRLPISVYSPVYSFS